MNPRKRKDAYADLRQLLFADEPLASVAAYVSQQGAREDPVWGRLGRVASLVREDQQASAIRELRQLLEDEGDDARTCFQVWSYLRQLGEPPGPEVARRVLGLVLEHSQKGSPEILAAYWDGTARYMDEREDFRGFGQPAPAMVATVRRFLRTSRPLVEATRPMTGPRAAPPTGRQCRISVLTPAGLHTHEDAWDALWNDERCGPILDGAGELSRSLMEEAASKGLWSKGVAPWPRRGEPDTGGPPPVH